MADAIEKLFGTRDFYAILGVTKSATDAEIRKAYYKQALKLHPDRNLSDSEATHKFQQLSLIYETLSDAGKRKVYDDTGLLPEDDPLAGHQTRDWEAYWRMLYKQISREDIEAFEKRYKGSAEEETDLLEAYKQGKGSMEYIIDNVILATPEDEDRFRQIIERAIEAGTVRKFKAFTSESSRSRAARQARYAREAAEAEREAKKLHVDTPDGLQALILARQRERAGALAALEARFAKAESTGKQRGAKQKAAARSKGTSKRDATAAGAAAAAAAESGSSDEYEDIE